MNPIGALWHGVQKLNGILFTIGALFIAALAVLTIIDVTGRYLLNLPLPGTLEISELLMATVIFLCLPYSFSLKTHINVDIIVERLSVRKRLSLEVLSSFLTLVFLALIVWQGARIAIAKSANYTDVLHIPTFPFALLVPAGCVLASGFLAGKIISDSRSLKGSRRQGQ